jgi:RNA polymerase sigma-70 factor, ECF subfamily
MDHVIEINEQAWLSQLREGDENALRQLFNRYYPLLLTTAYRLVPDEETCKDLAQEVFVELWNKREQLEIRTSVRAYLQRATVNRTLNYIKTRKRTVLEEPADQARQADTSQVDIDQKADLQNLEDALHQAIGQLPEKCRIVFSLSRFEQLSHREIAEQLGISVKTIENQITKAMKFLRNSLTQYVDLSAIVIFGFNWLLLA